MAGIGVDAHGALVGYLKVCHDQIDGATLHYEASASSTVAAGSWTAARPVTDAAEWSLTAPDPAWSATTPMAGVARGRQYTLYGWARDNGSSAISVTFTIDALARLEPGQVLHWSGRSGGRPERDLNEISTAADFATKACRLVGS
jgi:hypothetical protein